MLSHIWLALVNVIISNSIPFPIQRSGCQFSLRLDQVFSYMDTTFSLSANGYLGQFHFCALVNGTTINIAVQVALWVYQLIILHIYAQECMVGSQGNSSCGFPRTRPSTINSGCPHFTVRWWNPYELGLIGRTWNTGPESGLRVSCLFPCFYILCFSLEMSIFAVPCNPPPTLFYFTIAKAMWPSSHGPKPPESGAKMKLFSL